MNRILGIALLLAFTSVVWGQTSGNPFDLKYRPAKSNVPATPKPILTPADTLSKSGLPIRPSTVTPDTTKIVRDTMDMPGSAISSDSLPVIGTNPFERADGNDSVTG